MSYHVRCGHLSQDPDSKNEIKFVKQRFDCCLETGADGNILPKQDFHCKWNIKFGQDRHIDIPMDAGGEPTPEIACEVLRNELINTDNNDWTMKVTSAKGRREIQELRSEAASGGFVDSWSDAIKREGKKFFAPMIERWIRSRNMERVSIVPAVEILKYIPSESEGKNSNACKA